MRSVLLPLPPLLRWLVSATGIAMALAGCVTEPRHTSYDDGLRGAACPATQAHAGGRDDGADATYYLHVLEFDDQGWAFADRNKRDSADFSPTYRIDCAIRHLQETLEKDHRKVLTFVYVHGWHHTAADGDADLEKFHKTLRRQYARHGQERRVIGFYVGWNGESIDVPALRQTTFWGRKNAAHHVAEGSVREFFARLKAMRDYWNRKKNARTISVDGCDRDDDAPEGAADSARDAVGPDCPIRTVMMGHSFGGLILYAATSPYILEMLASGSDVPRTTEGPKTARERGIADLVVLLNPAFEATRYDAVHNAARRYHSATYHPPLLISITSDDDSATGTWFPIVRTVNSALQYPATSELESRAMKRTHGHMDEYLTHELRLDGDWSDRDEGYDPCNAGTTVSADGGETADQMRRQFAERLSGLSASAPLGRLERRFCGGLALRWLDGPLSTPHSIVWNIRTHRNVITGHNGIHKRPLDYFLEQLYEDLAEMPRLRLAR